VAKMKQKIGDVEIFKRRKAVEFARASVELEGLTVSPQMLILTEKFITGNATMADILNFKLEKLAIPNWSKPVDDEV
jgi:hypothetical protein